MHSKVRTLAAAALIFVLGGAGCRDATTLVPAQGALAPRSITPRVVVVRNGTDAVLTLALEIRGDVGKIGSYTGRMRFDAASLVYDGEVAITDGTVRASNPGNGIVRVAGASLSGIDVAQLAAFRFTVANVAALSTVQFDLEEVHELSHTNLGALLVRASAVKR